MHHEDVKENGFVGVNEPSFVFLLSVSRSLSLILSLYLSVSPPQAGGDVKRLDGRGESPLHIAARHDKGEAVTTLVTVSKS